jgi:hypothetical protein
MAGEQAAVEYAGTTVRDMLSWTSHAVQEHWYYAVGAVVLLVALWRYLRK